MFAALPFFAAACWAPTDLPPNEMGEPPAPVPGAAPNPVASSGAAGHSKPPTEPLPPGPGGFAAWTAEAPLTLVGPGGAALGSLERAGVRVDVLQVLPARIHVRCTFCPAELANREGWLQNGSLRRAPTGDHTALDATLALRAAIVRGQSPLGAGDAGAWCTLLDTGFVQVQEEARFAWGGGQLLLLWDGQTWKPAEQTAPTAAGSCAEPVPDLAPG